MTIGRKLTLGISLIVLLVAGVALYAADLSRRALRASIEANAEHVASEAISEIERVLHDRAQGWRLLSRAPEFQKALRASNEQMSRRSRIQSWIDRADREWRDAAPGHPTSLARRISESPLSKLLRADAEAVERQAGYRVYGEVFVTNRFGVNIAQTGVTTDFRQDDEVWWKRARDRGIFVGDVDWDESSHSLATDLCIRVDDDHGRFMGVVKAVLDIGFANRILAAREGSSDSDWTLRLAGRTGRILQHTEGRPNAPVRVTLPGCLDRIAASATSGSFVCGTGRDGRIPVFTTWARMGPDSGLGWLVLRQSPAERAFAPIEAMSRSLIAVAVAAGAIAALLGILFSRSLSRRIQGLREVMREVGRGDLEVRVSLRGRDELRDLGESFNAMAADLRCAKEEASTAESAKTRFIANLSHEIRDPLTVAMGHAELLLDPSSSESQRREFAQTIRTSARQLIALVDNVVDLGSIESGQLKIEPTRFSPCALVGEVVDLMRGVAERKGLTLEARLLGPLPATIESDPLRLRQILVNLIDNAIKFTECGGITISVSLDCREDWPPALGLEISDGRSGIAPDRIDRLFYPFERIDGSIAGRTHGTGLGLAVSCLFAELLGGGVSVSSEPRHGSIFTVKIATGSLEDVERVEHPEDLDLLLRANQSDPAELGRLEGSVLIVDDEPLIQSLVQTFLEKAGAEVGVASDGFEGIERLRAGAPGGRPWDLVLMDLKMPRMDGWTAARRLREEGYTGPLIALSAVATCGVRARCLEAGFDDYLCKPIARAQLIGALRRYLS